MTLELGGKSPLIVFEDADLDDAVSGALLANFYSAGEVCSNGTRVFVHRKVKAAFLEKLVARVERMVVGDPLDPATQVGALISQAHMEKVLGYIVRGRAEGRARIPRVGGQRVMDGAAPGQRLLLSRRRCSRGCSRRHDHRARGNLPHGPVMTVLDFEDEDEVIARANATDFGLAAGVFTKDLNRAPTGRSRGCRREPAGSTTIISPLSSFLSGGVKQSGLGRENGPPRRCPIEHYSQLTERPYVALSDIESPY